MREMNAQHVIVTMRDKSVFHGFINIGACRRLSDFFRKPDDTPFIVLFNTTVGESKEEGVYFLNWNQILWVEPNEVGGPPLLPGRVASESLLK